MTVVKIFGHRHGFWSQATLLIESHILFCAREQHFVCPLGLGNVRQLQNNAIFSLLKISFFSKGLVINEHTSFLDLCLAWNRVLQCLQYVLLNLCHE
jgi:hypothetical protein